MFHEGEPPNHSYLICEFPFISFWNYKSSFRSGCHSHSFAPAYDDLDDVEATGHILQISLQMMEKRMYTVQSYNQHEASDHHSATWKLVE